jgi:uncharacterized protein (DUF1800 family)
MTPGVIALFLLPALMPFYSPRTRLSTGRAKRLTAPPEPASALRPLWASGIRRLLVAAGISVLASCGGGGGGAEKAPTPDSGLQISAGMLPADDGDTYRFLTQATFGPSATDIDRVNKIGYDNWIDEQFKLNLQRSHLDTVLAVTASRQLVDPPGYMLTYSWWTHAIADPAQLRQRVAFALSEIFVVSNVSVDTRMVSSYLDMLTDKADGSYRDLLEAVALHPAMGTYLSHISNRKEDPSSGRVPDENFAREVMQLFSIGLYELDDSAHPRLANNQMIETYTADDVKGMAKVFTGWGWHRPAGQASTPWWLCFWRAQPCQDSNQFSAAMEAYDDPAYNQHSTSIKQFLGVTVPAQTTPNARASLNAALDRLATHPNTAPFISKQLIQRLVTSNPSDTYVADITRVFRSSGGSLKAVVKAILLHAEARRPGSVSGLSMDDYGKLREPVLRLTHVIRSLPHTSSQYAASGLIYLADDTSDPGTQLGQTPMQAASVFNYFRPGYTPPQTSLSAAGMVAPEMQITNETTVLGYANFMAAVLNQGWGQWNQTTQRMDVQFDLSQWDSVAAQPAELVKAIGKKLLGKELPASVATTATNAITAMPSNDAAARKRRVQAAILMTTVSPSFLIQQ